MKKTFKRNPYWKGPDTMCCPGCGHVSDHPAAVLTENGATVADNDSMNRKYAEIGDFHFVLCLECAAIIKLEADGSLHMLTIEQVKEAMQSKPMGLIQLLEARRLIEMNLKKKVFIHKSTPFNDIAQPCPCCTRQISGGIPVDYDAEGYKKEHIPVPNESIIICSYCGTLFMYNEDFKLYEPDNSFMEELSKTDPDTAHLLKATQQFYKELRKNLI